jgi:hypothetical protein
MKKNPKNKKELLEYQKKVLGIKVQSVELPNGFNYKPKTEEETLIWLRDKIQNIYFANYESKLKYSLN